jgi:aldose sugar dehydrogenase
MPCSDVMQYNLPIASTPSFIFWTSLTIGVGFLFTFNFAAGQQTINDPNLRAELVFEGLKSPTSMAFLGEDDFLVLEKDKGTVQRIVNGNILKYPLLDANVAQTDGMLGIAIAKNVSGPTRVTYVFLYYTEAKTGDTDDTSEQLGNRLYRYELINGKLVNPKLLLDLPVGPIHNAGIVSIGPDNNLYASNGQLGSIGYGHEKFIANKAINYEDGADPDGRAGILTITQNGQLREGILGNRSLLNLYYAYGIRNSFGMDFDPKTEKLWMTENGPDWGDEINLVEPGFNSGWALVQGTMSTAAGSLFDGYPPPSKLVDFGGSGKYSSPEFIWNETVGPTALKFLNSNRLGIEYENTMFVGDVSGTIYNFRMNNDRTELFLEGRLSDRNANNSEELQNVVFAEGFRTITDLEVGPDGYLYIVSMDDGKIYKIIPRFAENVLNP